MNYPLTKNFGQGDSEIQDILAMCSTSTKMTAKFIFPDRFSAEFAPAIHDPIFELIDSDVPRVAIAAPRGFGKTSVVGLGLAGRKVLFRQSKFLPYVSQSFDSACLQTENLKIELASNPMIKQFFGPIKGKNAAGMDDSFSKKSWVALDTLIYPRGSGQQIRGILYKNARPDLIVIDDLEDADSIESEDIRRKRKEWFFADLVKSVSRFDKKWKIVYIDTLKHEDSLLQELLDASDWESIRLEACDDNLKATAPEFLDDAEIKQEFDSHRDKGILDVFYREFRNLPIATEDAVFKQEYFKYYEEVDLDHTKVENIIIVDPAKTAKMQSADSAIVVVGIDRESNAIYLRDVVSGKFYPDQLYDEMFKLKIRFNVQTIGVETTGLEEFIKQPIKNEMIRRGLPIELIWLKARGGAERGDGKLKRIAALSPYYRQGLIYHNRTCCSGIEAQLMSFPRSKRLDIMDAFAYTIEMMELGERYFEPINENPEDVEAEFAELDYDDSFDEWRTL